MKHIRKLLFIIVVVAIFASCKNEIIIFDSSKTFVAFTSSALTVQESADVLNVPVMVAALNGSPALTVSFDIVSDEEARPAVEGVDFTVTPDGTVNFAEGSGIINLQVHPIDNDQFTGDKSFKIVIISNSANYNTGAQSIITVVLKDDEHPLAKWIGTYDVAAASYGNPGAWDEAWVVTTEPDPDDVNNLLVYGVGSEGSGPLVGVVNTDDMTITFSSGQPLGEAYGDLGIGAYNLGVYKGTDTGDIIPDEPLVGVIEEDGTIQVDLWGHMIDEGSYNGYIWDVFNTTWTKQ